MKLKRNHWYTDNTAHFKFIKNIDTNTFLVSAFVLKIENVLNVKIECMSYNDNIKSISNIDKYLNYQDKIKLSKLEQL